MLELSKEAVDYITFSDRTLDKLDSIAEILDSSSAEYFAQQQAKEDCEDHGCEAGRFALLHSGFEVSDHLLSLLTSNMHPSLVPSFTAGYQEAEVTVTSFGVAS